MLKTEAKGVDKFRVEEAKNLQQKIQELERLITRLSESGIDDEEAAEEEETLPEKMARKRSRLKQIRLSYVKKPKRVMGR